MMKKSLSILSVLMVLLCGIAFTACGLLDDVPEEEWEMKSIEYSIKDTAIQLDCYMMFTSEGCIISGEELDPGLNIMIVPAEFENNLDLIVELFGEITDSQYILINLPLNESAEIDDDSDGGVNPTKKAFKVNKTKWSIMYYGVKWDERESTDPKTYLKSYDKFEGLGNLSLSALLKNFLVTKLLD